MSNNQSRKQLVQRLSKNLIVATPLVVAAFSMSQIATAQSSNCPAGSKFSQGVCMATSSYQTPTYQGQSEAEAQPEATYQAQPEAEAQPEATYQAQPEAEAQPEATFEAQPEAEAQPVTYEAEPEAQAEAEPEAQAEAEPEAKAEAEAPNRTISGGTWTKKSFRSKGAWSLAVVDGVTTISLDDDFSTRNAPDLKIFLSPLSAGEVKNKTAINGSLLIAPLKSNKGQQSYTVPAGTDLSKYKSVIIHCEQYTKLWSASDL